MSDPFTLATAIFSAIATAFAALATWRAPTSAAKLAETLRRDSERAEGRARHKLEIFATLMQERAAIYSEPAVRALNSIDVLFSDSRKVREAWAELYRVFNTNPIPAHLLDERLRKPLTAIAEDIGLADSLGTDDLGRVYSPIAVAQERQIRDIQRQQTLASLTSQSSPATNTAVQESSAQPPQPE